VRRNYGPVTVPAGHYFMMGDNRDNSQDSRYWGFMPRDYVKGKALFVYFSYGENPGGPTNVRWARILHQIH
jgi:signal peptidase I